MKRGLSVEFIQVTMYETKDKNAIRISDIQSFRESSIQIDNKDEKCLLIIFKDDNWIKVRETFDEFFHVINQKDSLF